MMSDYESWQSTPFYIRLRCKTKLLWLFAALDTVMIRNETGYIVRTKSMHVGVCARLEKGGHWASQKHH